MQAKEQLCEKALAFISNVRRGLGWTYLMSPHVGHRYLDGSVEHTSQEPGILFKHTRALRLGAHPSFPSRSSQVDGGAVVSLQQGPNRGKEQNQSCWCLRPSSTPRFLVAVRLAVEELPHPACSDVLPWGQRVFHHHLINRYCQCISCSQSFESFRTSADSCKRPSLIGCPSLHLSSAGTVYHVIVKLRQSPAPTPLRR